MDINFHFCFLIFALYKVCLFLNGIFFLNRLLLWWLNFLSKFHCKKNFIWSFCRLLFLFLWLSILFLCLLLFFFYNRQYFFFYFFYWLRFIFCLNTLSNKLIWLFEFLSWIDSLAFCKIILLNFIFSRFFIFEWLFIWYSNNLNFTRIWCWEPWIIHNLRRLSLFFRSFFICCYCFKFIILIIVLVRVKIFVFIFDTLFFLY